MTHVIGQRAESAVVFEAVIVPHRSLSRRGHVLLISAIILLSAITSVVFWRLGAWPVAGFSGAEIGLAVVLLRANSRARRASETLLLSPDMLRIVRCTELGHLTETFLPTGWLAVTLQERNGRVPALLLSAGGRTEEVGTCLGEAEKRDLAVSLAGALHRLRHPVFDNPQLRD